MESAGVSGCGWHHPRRRVGPAVSGAHAGADDGCQAAGIGWFDRKTSPGSTAAFTSRSRLYTAGG